jgi:hypothetical protein
MPSSDLQHCGLPLGQLLASASEFGRTLSSRLAEWAKTPMPKVLSCGCCSITSARLNGGSLVGIVALDLILAWTGHPIGWLRQLTR